MSDVETVMYVSAPVDADFDEATHTWTVGDKRSRILIAVDGTLPGNSPAGSVDLPPYLGVALRGVPNYFLLTGPDVAAQKGYVAKCLQHLDRVGGTRIEVRAATQAMFAGRSDTRPRSGHYWRRVGGKIASSFDVRSGTDSADDAALYSGPATLRINGRQYATRVRLTGRLDPIDGRYHWQGTVFGLDLRLQLPQDTTVMVGAVEASARLTERTPQSTYAVAGVGAPPYVLDRVEVDVPLG